MIPASSATIFCRGTARRTLFRPAVRRDRARAGRVRRLPGQRAAAARDRAGDVPDRDAAPPRSAPALQRGR